MGPGPLSSLSCGMQKLNAQPPPPPGVAPLFKLCPSSKKSPTGIHSTLNGNVMQELYTVRHQHTWRSLDNGRAASRPQWCFTSERPSVHMEPCSAVLWFSVELGCSGLYTHVSTPLLRLQFTASSFIHGCCTRLYQSVAYCVVIRHAFFFCTWTGLAQFGHAKTGGPWAEEPKGGFRRFREKFQARCVLMYFQHVCGWVRLFGLRRARTC